MAINRQRSILTRGLGVLSVLVAGTLLVSSASAQDKKPELQKGTSSKTPPSTKAAPNIKSIGPQAPATPPVQHKSKEQLAKENAPHGTAEFVSPDHDFGEQWVGRKLNHVFEVKNVGDKPLKILNVKPACGCTLVNYDKVVEPGATGKITVAVDSKKLFGPFRKTIRVTTDDPLKASATLSISGKIKHYVETKPRSLNFRNLKPAEEKDITMTLKNNGEEPLELTLVKSDVGKSFTAEIIEKTPGKEFELIVHAKPPYKEGRFNATVSIKTNVDKQPELKIRVSANALPRIEIKPKQIVITRPKDAESTQRINITNHGNSPVHLLGATVDDEKLSLTTKEIDPGKKYQVEVTMPAGYKPDAAGKTITLKFDDSEKPVVTVKIRSNARKLRPAQLLEGKPAPQVQFTTHGGFAFNSEEIKDKAVVLKFYTTWCGFCKKSLPKIEEVYQEYKDKGVRFIAVNLDNPNSPRKSKAFTKEQSLAKLKDLGVTFDVVFDPNKEASKAFKVSSFPTMFVLDGSGKVANVSMGAITGSRIIQFKKQLDKILAAGQDAKAEAEAPKPTAISVSSGAK